MKNRQEHSKYDQPYGTVHDLIFNKGLNNSLSLMAAKISAESRVLEFGPASGYMTRYLTEELKCAVYIVEIDPGSAERARPYTADVYIGDIEKFDWAGKWAGEKFDTILFADVLEHLIDPQNVLRVAGEFLKPDGRILASIPNLAHNSVLIELWNNRFAYRETGLLDSAHLRFFSEESVRGMFCAAGLDIRSIQYTSVMPKNTEFHNSLKQLPWIVRRAFAKRPLANVYQFVVEASLRL